MSPEEFVNQICSKNGWNYTEQIAKNLCIYLRAEQHFQIKRNNRLLAEKDIFSHQQCPTGLSEMGLLISLWKQPHTNAEIIHISSHPASPSRNLRKRGFRFRVGEKKDGYTAKNFIFKKNGKDHREIIGFDPSRSVADAIWDKICKRTKNNIKLVFNEDLMGDTYAPRYAEIDHRSPEMVRLREGFAPVPLTEDTVRDGSWIKHYQVMSKTSNNRKREACTACQSGGKIKIPLGLSVIRSAYKHKYDEDNKGCVGCWWYNPLQPKRPDLLCDLDWARMEQNNKIERIIQKSYGLHRFQDKT